MPSQPLRSLALAALAAAACSTSGASGTATTRWRGQGVVVGLDGRELGSFGVSLSERHLDAQTVEIRGEVQLADGRKIPIEHRRIGSAERFRLETERGKGGGLCFGEGLCQTYEDVGEGRGFASTLVHDEDGRLRVLTTELDHGHAVRFTRQSLSKSE